MAPLGRTEQIILIALSSTSGCLSLCGSVCIVLLAMQRRERGTYHRLLLTMSLIDIIHSIAIVFQPFLLPKDPGRLWSIGNDTTCSISAFFVQFSLSVSFYNMMLNLNYLLTIRYEMDEKRLAKWVEPWMHLFSILYPLATATWGVSIGMFSNLELGQACWISDFPRGCEEDPDTECVGSVYGWIFFGFPLLATLVFLLVSNVLIYLRVRQIVVKVRRFSTISHDDSQRRKKQDVGTQASLYVAACFNTVIWQVVTRTLESMGVHREDESSVLHLLILTNFFFPLQGFWNLLIYVRPRYLRWRRRAPEESRWWSFKQALHPNPIVSESFVSIRRSMRMSRQSMQSMMSRRSTLSESGDNIESPGSLSVREVYLDDTHVLKKKSSNLLDSNRIVDPQGKLTLDEMFRGHSRPFRAEDNPAPIPIIETEERHSQDGMLDDEVEDHGRAFG